MKVLKKKNILQTVKMTKDWKWRGFWYHWQICSYSKPHYKFTVCTSSVLIQNLVDIVGHCSKEYSFEEKPSFPDTPVFPDGISWVPI